MNKSLRISFIIFLICIAFTVSAFTSHADRMSNIRFIKNNKVVKIYEDTTPCQPFEADSLRQMACGLWINSEGDIFYKDKAMAPPDIYDEDSLVTVDYYIDRTYNGLDSINEYVTLLKNVIDTATFEFIGNFYFKDKNYVYILVSMVYGGHLVINHSADVETFRAMNSPFYACGKNECYFAGMTTEGADPETFRVIIDSDTPVSRDKNNFYIWNEIMTEEDIIEYEKNTGINLRATE